MLFNVMLYAYTFPIRYMISRFALKHTTQNIYCINVENK